MFQVKFVSIEVPIAVFRFSFYSGLRGKRHDTWGIHRALFPVACVYLVCLGAQPSSRISLALRLLFRILDI